MLYSSDFVFSGQHTRTVNRVRFHENDAHLLLSGSQDGSMHIFVSVPHTVEEFSSNTCTIIILIQ